jgi:hypothetical protein
LPPKLEDPADNKIADLFHQLVDDGGNVVRAEINLYKQIALHRAGKARNGLIALVVGALLMLAALIVLLLMLALGLAVHVGPVGAGLLVAAAATLLGFGLLRYGADGIGALAGDEEERASLRGSEKKP